MTYDPVQVALHRFKQLDPDNVNPHNRSEIPSKANAQCLAVEQAFSSQLPDEWQAIQESLEWRQLQADSPLHPEQFEAFVRRYAARTE